MFDLKNNRHIDDQALLFVDEDNLDNGCAGILRVSEEEGEHVVEITTGDYSERVLVASVEDAEMLMRALGQAIQNGWWSVLED